MRPIACTGRFCKEEMRIKCVRFKFYAELMTVDYTIKDGKCNNFVPIKSDKYDLQKA